MTTENYFGQSGGGEARPACPPVVLRSFQEDFARRFAEHAGALTGSELTVTSGGWSRQSYAQFLAALAEHTCCHILAVRAEAGRSAPAPADTEPIGYVWLEVGRGIAFAMIDALLGGDGRAYVPDRALTGVERGVLRHVIDVAGDCLAESWARWSSVSFEVLGPSAMGARQGLGHVEQPVTVLALHLAMSGQAGALRLCLPQSLLSPGGAVGGSAPAGGGPVEISVVTPDVTLSSSDLADLSAGDILTTDTRADGEVIVRVAGIPKFCGRLGTCNGRRAVTITGRIAPPRRAART